LALAKLHSRGSTKNIIISFIIFRDLLIFDFNVMLTNRQNQLLKTIVHQYIETAQPISSDWLAENFRLDEAPRSNLRGIKRNPPKPPALPCPSLPAGRQGLGESSALPSSQQPAEHSATEDKGRISSATVRNEMAVLLEKGFLFQPHTSAGRVPTEKTYHYYIKNFLNTADFGQNKIKQIEKFKNKTGDGLAKELSQMMAELTGELAIMAFDKNNFYYTGFSNLFSQPEFSQSSEEIYGLGQIVDRLDRTVFQIFDQIEDEPQILLGRENPFGEFCAAIFTRLELPAQKEGVVFGLLGPIRMDYNRNLNLINYVKKTLNS